MSLAFVYPGQGSQSVGMGKFLFENFTTAKRAFEESSDAISVDMKKLCFEGPEETLMLTENTQPAIVTVSAAATLVLKEEFGLNPSTVAGHSVGEYAACIAAEVLSLSDAVVAVKNRGQYMQEAVPAGVGAMAAFMGVEASDVVSICKWAESTSGLGALEPANFNAPGQIVISGHAKVLSWLSDHLDQYPWPGEKPKRLKVIPLKVSAPFHCSLMLPAQEKMQVLLEGMNFNAPKCQIIQNVTADVTTDPALIRKNLVTQMSGSVRWIESMEKLSELGVTRAIEVGSGQVLKGLMKKILPEFENFKNINSLEEIKSLS
ncbi:MAG: ACP S-malonyltransferase [Bdellovibrionaceae bacterium]|nr:ACP S-malonyltransferase [Pseudobdellovibrionaceae bacterium]